MSGLSVWQPARRWRCCVIQVSAGKWRQSYTCMGKIPARFHPGTAQSLNYRAGVSGCLLRVTVASGASAACRVDSVTCAGLGAGAVQRSRSPIAWTVNAPKEYDASHIRCRARAACFYL